MLVDSLCSARVFKRFSRSIHYSTTKDLRHYVNFVIENSITSAIGKEEIVGITKRDQELQKLIGCLEKANNDPRDGDMRKYSSVFNKLAVVDGIVLRRERIVVPQDSKDYPRRKPGIVRTKQLLRAYVWFPGMDVMVERHVGKCLSC